MKRRKKYYILGAILFMAIGFAAITTTLVLNGTLTIGENRADFGIYFSKSILDSQDVSKETISTDGQVINFEAELSEVGKPTELEYEVTNSSRNYDAQVSVACQFKPLNEGTTIDFDEYVTMSYPNEKDIILARSTGTGSITLTLKKSVIEEIQVGLECRLDFEPIERESLGENPSDNDPNNYTLSGYLVDDKENPLPNTTLVIVGSDNEKIYITSNGDAYLTIEGLDMGFYDIYIIENKTIEEIKEMSNEEIKENALTKAKFTQSSKEITFENGYKIVDKLNKKEYTITFDADGGKLDTTTKKVTYNDTYGELPIPTKDGYEFEGWFTEKTGGTEVKSTTKVDITTDQKLYAHWKVSDILVDVITELAKTDETNLVYDGTEDNNLRYVGANPNNYVKFNDELWRIIGVMNNVEDATGTKAKHVKLIKETAISNNNNYTYDNTPQSNGVSDWSVAALQKMLNSGSYWNRTSGTCPTGSNGYTSNCDFSSTGLTDAAKKMISNVVWHLGGVQDPGSTAQAFYEGERGTNTVNNHATKWTGKVGLMYPSDYGYAVGGDARTASLTTVLGSYGQFSSYNWLNYSYNEWTITPSLSGNQDYLAFYKNYSSRALNIQSVSYTSTVRPSVYLSSYIRTIGGSGTSDDPYILALNENANYVVGFDANGGEKVNTVLTVKNGATYGELPTTQREGFGFEGWFTEKTGGTQVTSTTKVDLGDNQTLYAHWTIQGILKDGIVELAKTDTVNLAKDGTSQNNVRYIGADPNNYVKFNGELWRIIGVMNDVEDSTGTKAQHVKIIREQSIGIYSYDNKPSGTGTSTSSSGSNDWSDSRLMTTLNNGPYWNRTSGTCYKGYSYNGGTANCDFSETGLSKEAKRMVSNVVWNLGGTNSNSTSAPASYFYTAERGTDVYSGHATKWTGKVGLMYPSDFKYAVDGSNNWLYTNGVQQWTITPTTNYDYSVFITYSGNISTTDAAQSSYGDVMPVVYLNSNIKVVSGNGTKGNPYELALNESTEYTYTVNFDTNGGEKENTVLTVTYGSNYGTLPIPTREGYDFDGWFTEKDGGTQITSTSKVEITDNQTLYAHWTVNGNLIDVVTKLEETDGTNLAYDGTADNNLRYIGANPNNYVYFNCSDKSTEINSSTCEKWRIIGVMNNIEDSSGNQASHIKIIRPQSIGSYSWDNKPEGIGSSTSDSGSNDWSDARLMEVLNNEGPYWNRTSGTCYVGSDWNENNTTTCDFSETGLTERARSMISTVVWNLGGNSGYESLTSAFYESERGTTPYSGHAATWTGNVGIMYASDYGYAVGGTVRSKCLAKNLNKYYTDYCYANDWLNFEERIQWTLTANSKTSNQVFDLGISADIESVLVYAPTDVNPTVHLDTGVKVVGGSGTESDPYKLELGNSSGPNIKTYTVTFDANGGNTVSTVMTVTSGGKYGSLPTTTREGYSFAGWFTEKNGGTQVTEGTKVDINESQTLYARWTVVEKQNLKEYITKLPENDETNLAYDDTTDKNLRYIGENPNNYVLFNDELWQIVGLMNNITDSDGNKASHIKIIRANWFGRIGDSTDQLPIAWNANYSDDYSNDWSTSTLQKLLNEGDYYNRTGTTYYRSIGLTDNAKSMISNVIWNLGGIQDSKVPASTLYAAERGTTVYAGRPTTWAGEVGLMYGSDYKYAVGGNRRAGCLEGLEACKENNWMNKYGHIGQWTLTPDSSKSNYVFWIPDDSYMETGRADLTLTVRPVVYLNTNIQITGGAGTESDPYTIALP